MVDSRWTMTVLGAKLLQAGSGPVFPFALADSSQDGDDWDNAVLTDASGAAPNRVKYKVLSHHPLSL